jgi:ribose transport system substrate-binding protein
LPRKPGLIPFACIAFTLIASLFACSGPKTSTKGKQYTIYISNNFVGNDWRQQMLRSAETAVKKAPLAGRVDLKIENVETTTQAQLNSLTNIIRARPDAILIDASSATALNPTIEKACQAGILVISFDQVTTSDCSYGIQSEWTRVTEVQTEWLARKIGGKGKVIVDRGLAGAPVSDVLSKGYETVLRQFPEIEVVGYFNGNYALGPEQAGVANLLAANPRVDGILVQGYGAGAIRALQDAGRKLVPVTGGSFNLTALTCAQTPGAECILASNPPYLSAEALKLAVTILDGNPPASKHIYLHAPLLSTDPIPSKLYPEFPMIKLEVNKNAFPNLPPGLSLPFSPDWVEITPQEASGS